MMMMMMMMKSFIFDVDSGILEKNPTASLQESNLYPQPSDY